MNETVYRSKIQIDGQTRDIECTIQEISEAESSYNINHRSNEVQPMTLTSRLRLCKKDSESGLMGEEIIAGTNVSLGDMVRQSTAAKIICLL